MSLVQTNQIKLYESFIWPEKSIYFSKAYHELFSQIDKTDPVLVCLQSENDFTFFPFLKKKDSSSYFEGSSTYGYPGFFGSEMTKEKLQCLKEFLAKKNYGAVFLRHDPLSETYKKWPVECLELNRYVYIVELNELKKNINGIKFSQKIQWSINLAKRNGLIASFASGQKILKKEINDFYKIYKSFILSKTDKNRLLFSDKFFLDHISLLGENCDLGTVKNINTNSLECAAFFLKDNKKAVHYHLSASTVEGKKNQGMDFLLAQAIEYYEQQGFSLLNLGGGKQMDENDGLSRFKRKFSTNKKPFYISKILCDKTKYFEKRSLYGNTNKFLNLEIL